MDKNDIRVYGESDVQRTSCQRASQGGEERNAQEATSSNNKLLRVWGRSELAQLYYGRPISDRGARAWFMKELSYVPGLLDRLKELGLQPNGKIFSRAQVAEIFKELGPP